MLFVREPLLVPNLYAVCNTVMQIKNSGIVIDLEIIYSWQNQVTLQYLISKCLFLFYIMIFISTILIVFIFFFCNLLLLWLFLFKDYKLFNSINKNLKVVNQLLLPKYFVYVIVATFINFILQCERNVINSENLC